MHLLQVLLARQVCHHDTHLPTSRVPHYCSHHRTPHTQRTSSPARPCETTLARSAANTRTPPAAKGSKFERSLIIRHSITTTLRPSPWPTANLRSLARPRPLRRHCSQAGCRLCNQTSRHARVSSYKHLVPLLPKRAHINSGARRATLLLERAPGALWQQRLSKHTQASQPRQARSCQAGPYSSCPPPLGRRGHVRVQKHGSGCACGATKPCTPAKGGCHMQGSARIGSPIQ